MRKVYLDVKVKMIVKVNDNQPILDVLNDMEYSFTSKTAGATVEDVTLEDFNITDSK